MEYKYVLFSPIGTTDPISNYHDGAMLHIARKYRPCRIYLYLSKEMSKLHEMDDRYRRAVAMLSKKLGLSLDTHVYCNRELTDVHLFDYFYNEFEQRIKDVAEANPDCIVLLNVSSGTPAMKSALQTLAALSNNDTLLPIQVSTPTKSSNQRRDDFHKCDLNIEWELDEDNSDDYEDRTEISTTLNLCVRIKKESMIKHIEAYDYHAALSIANDISTHISTEALHLLEAANARIQLDISAVTKALTGTDYKIIPIEDSNVRDMAEYLLWLDIKLSRAEFSDFIRGITPLVADLFEMYTSKLLNKNFGNYCSYNKSSGKKILRRRLLESDETGQRILEILDSKFSEKYKDRDCSSLHLLPIINEFSTNDHNKELADNIRNIEENCRNIAAHEIVSITPEWIHKRSGFTPDKIMKMMFEMAEISGIPVSKLKGSYKEMNSMIKESLGCL